MAAMVPSSQYHHIQQLANMMHDKSVMKTKINIVLLFISYFKARCIVNVLCLCVCGLCQQAALRASNSQRGLAMGDSRRVCLLCVLADSQQLWHGPYQ